MHAGDQHPQQAEQAEDQERVVDPQPAACVVRHANIRSHEHVFWRKNYAWHICVSVLAVGLASGCVANPHTAQLGDLMEQLTAARGLLVAQPPRADEACTMVGTVQTRLYGEPGLVDVRPAWPQLRDAADALQAACGQGTMLGQPSTDSPAMAAARVRWQQGMQREVGVACDHLRAAAAALARGAPC